jgi:gluconate 2-dehydrogenase
MKPTATLVNIARGGIVDDAALARRCASAHRRRRPRRVRGRAQGAPRPADRAQRRAHAAHRQRHRAHAPAMADLAADNLIGFLVNGKPLTPLNPEVLG